MADITAEQAERAAKPLTMNQMADALVGSLVAAGECDPEPAPEVVDVPQPAPLPKTVAHFYTIRALPEPHRVSWNMPGDGPQWVRVNDALWLHVDDLRAMLADIDAQDRMVAIKGHHARWDAQLAPTRPEPRYKVGDWVRDGDGTARLVVEAPQWSRIQGQWRYLMASWSYSESELTPAIDPALRETARKTVAWLRGGPSNRDIAIRAHRQLPGAAEWDADYSGDYNAANARWAAQLERLLGDAP